jgi:general secretion pathway protein L
VADVANGSAVRVRVFQHRARGVFEVRPVARVLTTVLACAAVAAGISMAASTAIVRQLESTRQDVARQIAARRAAMRISGTASPVSAQSSLERRKNEAPAAVIVVEALSRLLPDHTYVTELRIEGDRLQLVGVTHDAPSLIQLIEQTPQFTRATFFAPTTRSPEDPGERFHIEARIQPVFTFSP